MVPTTSKIPTDGSTPTDRNRIRPAGGVPCPRMASRACRSRHVVSRRHRPGLLHCEPADSARNPSGRARRPSSLIRLFQRSGLFRWNNCLEHSDDHHGCLSGQGSPTQKEQGAGIRYDTSDDEHEGRVCSMWSERPVERRPAQPVLPRGFDDGTEENRGTDDYLRWPYRVCHGACVSTRRTPPAQRPESQAPNATTSRDSGDGSSDARRASPGEWQSPGRGLRGQCLNSRIRSA